MIVRMRSPCEPPVSAHLCNAYRPLKRPEMWVGQRDVYGLKLDRMAHFSPVGSYHIRGGGQPGCTTKLRQYFPTRIAFLRSARIFGVGKNAMRSMAQSHCLFQRPCSIGIKRDACVRETFRQCG